MVSLVAYRYATRAFNIRRFYSILRETRERVIRAQA